ncbi:RNA helicase [Sulfolobus tengchongensis]|uniref:RNA helicase n=1 Tax=Sulfolobus tengchongensis TaxID=207809 RepID=A0AAX4L2Q9_9CREN
MLRKGISKVLEILNCKETEREISGKKFSTCDDVNFILNFPTVYGKTELALILANYLSNHVTNNFVRVSHVVPNIVERGDEKEILSTRVQLKFSKFFFNLYDSSISDPSSELLKFSILTSIVIFDEYQLMPDLGLVASAHELAKAGVTTIFSTSTPSTLFEEEIIRRFRNYGKRMVVVSIVNKYGQGIQGRECVKKEEGYYNCKLGGVSYETVEVIDDNFKVPDLEYELTKDDILEIINKINDRVLVFLNSEDKAVEIYEKLKKKEENVCIFTSLRFIENFDNCKVLITTKLLDVNYPYVISEIAPLPLIVERAGRALRFWKEGEEGKLYVWISKVNYDSLTERTYNLLSNIKICLRHPFGCYNKEGYANKMVLKPSIDEGLIRKLSGINHLMDRRDLEKAFEALADFVMADLLISDRIVSVTPEFLYENKRKLLEYGNECVKVYFRKGNEIIEKCSRIAYDWLENGGILRFKRSLAKGYKSEIEEDGEKLVFLAFKVKNE